LAVPSFAEVELTTLPAALPVPAPGIGQIGAPSGGQVGIELPSGIRLTVDASIDPQALGRMVTVLNR